MRTTHLKLSVFCSMFLTVLSGFLYAQGSFTPTPINPALLEGFDEEVALRDLKEDKLDPDMVARFLDYKRQEYAGKKAGTWNVPRASLNASYKNGSGAQNSVLTTQGCQNVDFETGDFTNWDASYGYCPTYTNPCGPAGTPICPFQGFVDTRHTIMSGIGFDPYVGPALPVVSSGGSYSVRVGNDQVGGESEQLSYTFVVQKNQFSYNYAVVLEDPSHDPSQQPVFIISAFDQNGKSIDCAKYQAVAGTNVPGFRTVTSGWRTIRWKQWSTVTMDFSNFIGQTVTIRFTSADCGAGGHFGYAYIDCFCADLNVKQISANGGENAKTDEFGNTYICPGEDATLVAPDGFESYLWAPDFSTDQSILTNKITTYTVSMLTQNGCTYKLTHNLALFEVPNARFAYESYEDDFSVTFTDQSTIDTPGVVTKWFWEFGDGDTSSLQHPVHTYQEGGTYEVILTVESEDGCSDDTKQEINVGAYTFYASNAFTPNGDGLNDAFSAKGTGITQYKMVVYNRWGNKVFETTDLNETWKGNKTGSSEICDSEVYVWRAFVTDIFQNEYELNGHVVLLR